METMGWLDWTVILAGAAAVAWVNWYFFLARRSSVAAEAREGGVQEVTITVQGGYAPSEVRLRKGVPARLVFDRKETSSCSEEVVIPELGIRKYLPAFEKTVVEVRPERAGTFDFTCGMSMLHGKLVVEG
jgi:plastocyanin domain-containing protein